MADLLAARKETTRKLSCFDMDHEYPMVTSSVVFEGGMIMIDTTGRIQRAGGVAANGKYVLGRATRSVASAAAGEILKVEQGIFKWANAGAIAEANIGDLCYADDDQTVSLTNTNVPAGRIVGVDSDGVWVLCGLGVRN
jgi:hypothetical protein